MRILSVLLMFLSLCPQLLCGDDNTTNNVKQNLNIRTWTDVNGKTIKAELISIDNDSVVLRSENGKEASVKIQAFSKADQKYLGGIIPYTGMKMIQINPSLIDKNLKARFQTIIGDEIKIQSLFLIDAVIDKSPAHVADVGQKIGRNIIFSINNQSFASLAKFDSWCKQEKPKEFIYGVLDTNDRDEPVKFITVASVLRQADEIKGIFQRCDKLRVGPKVSKVYKFSNSVVSIDDAILYDFNRKEGVKDYFDVDGNATKITIESLDNEMCQIHSLGAPRRIYFFEKGGTARFTVTLGEIIKEVFIDVVEIKIERENPRYITADEIIKSIGLPSEKRSYRIPWPESRVIDGIGYSTTVGDSVSDISVEHWKYNEFPSVVISIQHGVLYQIHTKGSE